jgi:hypothetical protein
MDGSLSRNALTVQVGDTHTPTVLELPTLSPRGIK